MTIIESYSFITLADIWLKVSLATHDFIAPDYWQRNYEAMRDIYLPSVENYVYVNGSGDTIMGFISINSCHIEALFVDTPFQRKGVGKGLVDYVKDINICKNLTVNVYEENKNAVRFYLANGFVMKNSGVDTATGHRELYMEWKRP